jgi:hypothetical protein
LLLLVWLGLWAIGLISALLWYAFWIGILGAIGYGGYRLLAKKEETPRLAENTPIAIAEIRTDRVLEEYKKKYNDD